MDARFPKGECDAGKVGVGVLGGPVGREGLKTNLIYFIILPGAKSL